MSAPQARWRWVFPTWLSWEQAEIYTQLPRQILRELIISRQIRAQGLFSRVGHPTKINRFSIDELFRTAAESGTTIYWRNS
jgi:hypothetical protein